MKGRLFLRGGNIVENWVISGEIIESFSFIEQPVFALLLCRYGGERGSVETAAEEAAMGRKVWRRERSCGSWSGEGSSGEEDSREN